MWTQKRKSSLYIVIDFHPLSLLFTPPHNTQKPIEGELGFINSNAPHQVKKRVRQLV